MYRRKCYGEIRPRIKDNTACKTKLENIDQLGALLCDGE